MNNKAEYSTNTAAPVVAPSAADYIWFVLRAARRHIWLCLSVFAIVGMLGTTVALRLPALYGSSVKIYRRPNAALTASLAGGRRGAESGAMRDLAEAVMSRDNVLGLVREAKLLDRWSKTRDWPFAFADQVMARIFGEPTKSDRERALVGLLERWIGISDESDETIRFTVYWRDPETAYQLASLVQRNVLNDRRNEEQAAITRAIEVLEDEIARTNQSVPVAIDAVHSATARVRDRVASTKPTAAPLPVPQLRVLRPAPITEPSNARQTAELMERLTELRREQKAVLEPWQRRVAEIKFQLTELRTSLGPEHPTVRQQEAKLAAVETQPADVSRLQAEEAMLMASLTQVAPASRPARPTMMLAPAAPAAPAATSSPIDTAMSLAALDDPEIASARLALESILVKSRELQTRLDAARMELTTLEVGFKYRYQIVEPPEVTRKPAKPSRPKLLLAALALALGMGLLAGAARELLAGRVVEPWQIKSLGLPVLADIKLPDTSAPRA